MLSNEFKSEHKHCYHPRKGPIHMVVPDGHVVMECCKCSVMEVVHIDHMAANYAKNLHSN